MKKVHKTFVRGFRYDGDPALYGIPLCEQQAVSPASRHWKDVTCKHCLKKRKK